MIVGIGNDIIEIERIKKACSRKSFLEHCYTGEEIAQLGTSYLSLAGNFCVKEAVAKSMGTGFRTFGLTDIEVLRDALGKPYVQLYGGAKKQAEALGIRRIHVSISNLKDIASAVAVAEGEDVD